MHANDVIEAYVADVAVRLPRAQRNDVACELRALLQEELQARDAEDADTALALVRGFGEPADVAARYRPPVTVIDPAHGGRFWRLTLVGLGLIWSLGLWAQWRASEAAGLDTIQTVARWWGGVVLPSLWWPGVLVIGFALAHRRRQRGPRPSRWVPKTADRILGGRIGLALAMLGIVAGLAVLVDPRWLLDVIWNGRAAPAAYEALTYTDAFLGRQAPWLFGVLALNLPLYAAVIAKGRWTAGLRRLEDGIGLATFALMLWVVFDGPIFRAAASDGFARATMALIVAGMALHQGLVLYRRVRPAPATAATRGTHGI